jgi:hypothetical protein
LELEAYSVVGVDDRPLSLREPLGAQFNEAGVLVHRHFVATFEQEIFGAVPQFLFLH